MIKNKKKGFTLAEVLTTLMVIGVVAALTIPNLMNSYKERQTAITLKKTYAEISNAMKMIPIEKGCSQGDFACVGWFNMLHEERFNLVLSQFKGAEKIPLEGKMASFLAKPETNSFRLTNGTIIYMTDTTRRNEEYDIFDIYIDANGNKPPDSMGHDVFWFTVTLHEDQGIEGGTVLPGGSPLLDKLWQIENTYTPKESCFAEPTYLCAEYVITTGKFDYKKEMNK